MQQRGALCMGVSGCDAAVSTISANFEARDDDVKAAVALDLSFEAVEKIALKLGNLAAAEISDPDNDGVLTWQEYQANTNPRDGNSKLVIRSVVKGSDGRHQITFSTSTARSYRVLASSDLVNWQIVEENIEGIGADVTVIDDRFIPGTTQMYYRVQVY